MLPNRRRQRQIVAERWCTHLGPSKQGESRGCRAHNTIGDGLITIITKIITKLIRWKFCPVMFLSNPPGHPAREGLISVYFGAVWLCSGHYCHQNHYQINSLGIFPGNVPVKITEVIVGEFSSGSSLQDFVHGISVRVSWDR